MSRGKQGKKKPRKGRDSGSNPASEVRHSAPSPNANPQPPADITHLLRIEAINIDGVCDDTDQISIRRGGSLLLRQSVIDAKGWLRALAENDGLSEDSVKPISIGGSIGIYGLRLEQRDITSVIKHIEEKLNQPDSLYRLACFSVVACESDGTDYQDARERLLAQVRWQQLRQPNRYLPPLRDEGNGVCDFDHLSPAIRRERFLKRDDCFVGESVEQRFDYGQKQRGLFYKSELDKCKDEWDLKLDALRFTSDLHELSHNPRFGNLNEKIALVYFDGNGFSGYQQKNCKDIESQALFDEHLRGARRAFLANLLQLAASDLAFWSQQNIRLEVLMWGGDEFLLVVPAWKGWEVAQLFLKQYATISVSNTQRLTHAGGLVFCGAKTPIVRVRDLARQLADWAKSQDAGRDKNSLAYLVLESIEYPTQGIADYFGERFKVMAAEQRPLGASQLDSDQLPELLELIPSRLLHNLGRALVRHGLDSEEYRQRRDRTLQVLGKDKFEKASDLLHQLFPNQKAETDWPWLHFLELRDYLVPQAGSQTATEDGQ